MLNKTVKRTLLILAFLSLGLLNACIIPHNAPHGGYYYYDYYPTLGIYYDTNRHLYFYNHPRHGWSHNKHLPSGYVLKGHTSQRMKMRHAKPYQYKGHGGGGARHRSGSGGHRSEGHRSGGGHRSSGGGNRGGSGGHRGGGGRGLFK